MLVLVSGRALPQPMQIVAKILRFIFPVKSNKKGFYLNFDTIFKYGSFYSQRECFEKADNIFEWKVSFFFR